MEEINQGGVCKCPHHKMIPIFAVLIGLTFLLGAANALSASAVGYIWPILVIVAGLTKLCGSRCKCC